jgi:colicin import membrane protein
MRHLICGLLVAGFASSAVAIGQAEMEMLVNRVKEDPDVPGYRDSIDVRKVKPEWLANPARATIKYSRPNSYRGVLKRVTVRNDSDGDLVLDAGNGKEITAILYPYQFHAWKKMPNGKWAPTSAVTTLEYAAAYEMGQEFYMECKYVVPDYMHDCIVMPAEVAKSYD